MQTCSNHSSIQPADLDIGPVEILRSLYVLPLAGRLFTYPKGDKNEKKNCLPAVLRSRSVVLPRVAVSGGTDEAA